jgi:hypothetical protein
LRVVTPVQSDVRGGLKLYALANIAPVSRLRHTHAISQKKVFCFRGGENNTYIVHCSEGHGIFTTDYKAKMGTVIRGISRQDNGASAITRPEMSVSCFLATPSADTDEELIGILDCVPHLHTAQTNCILSGMKIQSS